ncbi:MAG: alpha/beta fold hydrolase, partial [Lachnospiraceae bacterium]|nr:alpha/beta fold hydrolase [Candidatus Merdinaster equi]
MKEDIYYPSRDGKTTIHGVIWKPESMCKGKLPLCILLVVHGMEEYIERYEPFAEYMNEHDIFVIGNDHLGHGKSVVSSSEYGYFGKGDIATVVVRDVHRLKKMVQEQYPGVPFFLMGHSMGSFIARNYIANYGSGIKGAVIMGTGSQPKFILPIGKALTNIIGAFRGDHYKSKLVQNMAMGSYHKRIPDPKTSSDWLSVNEENVRGYIDNPLCGFGFTVNGYHTLFEFISRCQASATVKRIPKDLPLLFVAGSEDPVGAYGEGVKKAYSCYEKAGVR